MKGIDPKALLAKVKAEIAPKKVRGNFTMDPDVLSEFMRKAGKGNASRVLEEFMRAFNASTPEPPPRKK